MNKEVNSMLFTDINGKWERIYTSEQVIETLQKDKEKLQTRIDKAIEYINIQCEDELLEDGSFIRRYYKDDYRAKDLLEILGGKE